MKTILQVWGQEKTKVAFDVIILTLLKVFV